MEEIRKDIWFNDFIFFIKVSFVSIFVLFFVICLLMYMYLLFMKSFGLQENVDLTIFKEVSLFLIGSILGFLAEKLWDRK